MTSIHFSRHAIDTAERVAEVGFVAVVAVVAAIAAATLIYAWLIA